MKMSKKVFLLAAIVISCLQLARSDRAFKAHAEAHFKALVSKSEKRKHGHATKLLTKIKPCGTGLEGTGTFSVEATSPDCINEVFRLTDVKNLPVTAMVPIWLAEKLGEESKNDTPFIRRFAIVLATGLSIVRQLLEEQAFEAFVTVWTTFESNLFKPSSKLTLKYTKGTVLKMMGKSVIDAIIDTVAAPCDLIPDVGISFIGSMNFKLSLWCRFGVTSLLKRLLNALIAKVAPLIEGAAAKKTELQCFQLDKLVKLLIGRIDKEYTVFDGSADDLGKILKPGDCMVTVAEKKPAKPGAGECCSDCTKETAKFRFKAGRSHVWTPSNKDPGINKLLQSQLRTNMLKGEIVKYGLMSLLEAVFDVAFDGLKEQLKKFISWTNKFVGAAKALPGAAK